MKTLTFTYTKKDGSVSSRTLLTQVIPSDKYAGIDVSDLDPTEANEFAVAAKALHMEFITNLLSLQAKFDVKHNYRQFLASGMSNIEEI